MDVFRVRIEAGGETYGSIWATRPRDRGEPDRTETRLLAAAADQVGQALRQDRLAAEAQAAEIARQSEALKSALLQSVSHDLRTPLATIRAAAGHASPDGEPERRGPAGERRRDRSRGRVPQPPRDQPARPVAHRGRGAPRGTRRVRARRPRRPDARAARAAARGSPAGGARSTRRRSKSTRSSSTRRSRTSSRTRSSTPRRARRSGSRRRGLRDEAFVRLTIEDGGPGVPDDALPRLFDKFYRVPGRGRRVALRDRDRARRGARPGRGDGRPRRRPAGASSAASRSTSTCHAPAPARGHRRESRRRDGPAVGAAHPTVLVVEDDEETRACRRSRARGSRLSTSIEAADGRTALARWEQRRPGPRPARPRPARHGRPPGHPPDPPRGADARSSSCPAATRSARRSRRSSAAPTTT